MTRFAILRLTVFCVWASARGWVPEARGDTHYVWKDNPFTPQSPFTNGWNSAATHIQDAIDVSVNDDVILVTNGVYDTGGTNISGETLTNRVFINKKVTVSAVSTNPADTVIVGAPAPGGGCGDGAIRCVAMYGGSTLIGFTVSNGFTRGASGVTMERRGGGIWTQGSGCVVSNCVVIQNGSDQEGGGVYRGDLYDCRIAGNTANSKGGGASTVTGLRCLLTDNTAGSSGGGVYNSNLDFSIISNNTAAWAGGAYLSASYALNNCQVVDNTASAGSGGVRYGTLRNCLVARNRAPAGGASYNDTVFINCTIASNVATAVGGAGGLEQSMAATNSVIYGNDPVDLKSAGYTFSLSFCCVRTNNLTTSVVVGSDNINDDPRFLDAADGDFQLHPRSRCVNRGSNAHAPTHTPTALNGNPRILYETVDIGAYETVLRHGTVMVIR